MRFALKCRANLFPEQAGRSSLLFREVTDFSYEVSGWNDGKAYVNITISGEKTYDVKGNSYSRGCLVGWKLYDSKGTVIDSGNFNTSNIAVNESFAETTSYINNLPVGVYTLELLNVG